MQQFFSQSEMQDREEYRDLVQSTTRTIQQLQGQKELDMSRDEIGIDLMEDQENVLSGLRVRYTDLVFQRSTL